LLVGLSIIGINKISLRRKLELFLQLLDEKRATGVFVKME